MSTNNIPRDSYLLEIKPDIDPARYGIVSPYKIFRYDRGDDRYYYTNPDNKGATGYLSVTSFTGKSLGISPYLVDWIVNMGSDAAEFYKNERAAYGTLMHEEIINIIKNGEGNFDELSRSAFDRCCDEGYKYNAGTWASDIVNDVASFLLFMKEKEVKIIAAEFPVVSPTYQLAGCIDLVVELTFNSKRVKAHVDLKSGRKGFFDAHKLQLECYKTIWNENFGNILEVTHIFNFAPQNIQNKTKFKLENQTNSVYADTCINRMQVARKEGWIKPPMQHMEIKGAFTVNDFDIVKHMVFEAI